MIHYTVYSMNNCPGCVATKNLLERNGLPMTILTAGKDFSVADLQEKVGQPVRTLPQIFADDEYVGGFDELKRRLATS